MAKTKREIDYDERLSEHDVRGPTNERLKMAAGHVSIGGIERSKTIYHMIDTPLARLYSRLVRASKREGDTEQLRVEYAALHRFETYFYESSMIGQVGSVDPNRPYSPSPSGRSFLSKTDKQLDMRDKIWHARKNVFCHHEGIVVDNVVLNERSLEVAGYAIGKSSKTRAIAAAELMLRNAGDKLAGSWGMLTKPAKKTQCPICAVANYMEQIQ